MEYEVFQQKIKALLEKVGDNTRVKFKKDDEKGKYYANLSDGTTIIGNPVSLKVTVRFWSGHQAVTNI